MNNALHALLPIHALRERRALRRVHEQRQAHEQAARAEADAADARRRLEARAGATLAGIGSAATTRASEMQWQLEEATSLKHQAVTLSAEVERLGEQKAHLQSRLDDARDAHLVQVRGHRKLQEASARWDRREARSVAARAEQLADDEFAVKWSTSADGQALA